MRKGILLLVAITVLTFALVLFRSFKKTIDQHSERVRRANLIVAANSSFVGDYGPATELKTEFEKTCDCTVEFVDVGGASAAVEKIKLDPKRRMDVILGLDHLMLSRVAQSIRWQKLTGLRAEWREEIKPFLYPQFAPYDWSPMGFLFRKGDVEPVHSWAEALTRWPDKSVSLQEPTLSSPGLEWLYWLFATSKNFAVDLKKLRHIVHSYSPSWSSSYGLFKKRQVPITFSYLTSLLYHWREENDMKYQFMDFTEGHPAQIEYAAVPDACWNCNVAKNFVAFLTTPYAQKVIAAKNYMLPTTEGIELDKFYSQLPKVKIIGPEKLDAFVNDQDHWIELWRNSR